MFPLHCPSSAQLCSPTPGPVSTAQIEKYFPRLHCPASWPGEDVACYTTDQSQASIRSRDPSPPMRGQHWESMRMFLVRWCWDQQLSVRTQHSGVQMSDNTNDPQLQRLDAFKALTLGVVTVLEVFLETIFMQNLASGVFLGFSCHIRHNPLISEIWIDIEHLWSRQMDKLSFNTNDYYSSALAFKIKMYQSSKERAS